MNLEQKLPARHPPKTASADQILRIAETKRLTAILYLKEKLAGVVSSSGANSHQLLPPQSPWRLASQYHSHAGRRKSGSASSSSSPTTASLPVSPTIDTKHAVAPTPTPTAAKAGPISPLVSPATSPNSTSYSKQWLIAAIIKLIGEFPTPLVALLWPLFVVGNSGLDDEDQRRFVLDNLRTIQKTRNLGSVRRARMTVEQAFRVKDLDLPASPAWGDDGPGVISLA
jgi:hypothetical protein